MYLDIHRDAEEKMKKTVGVYKEELQGLGQVELTLLYLIRLL